MVLMYCSNRDTEPILTASTRLKLVLPISFKTASADGDDSSNVREGWDEGCEEGCPEGCPVGAVGCRVGLVEGVAVVGIAVGLKEIVGE
jgi:hypothetical protein